MSSGHDVSEYELGASGLPRVYVKLRKLLIFDEEKKTLGVFDDPPEVRVISMFVGCLDNHDRAHSLTLYTIQ
jgi:hypothetical protein